MGAPTVTALITGGWLVNAGAARAANLTGPALTGAELVSAGPAGAELVSAGVAGAELVSAGAGVVGAGLVTAVLDRAVVLWLVDVPATEEIDAASTANFSLSLRAQPNNPSRNGDSPGTPGAPSRNELRPTIWSRVCDTTFANTFVAAGWLTGAGVVGVSTTLSCVVAANGCVAAAGFGTGEGSAVAGLLTTVCASTRGVAGACAPTSALVVICFDSDELVRGVDGGVDLVVVCCGLFALPCELLLVSAPAVVGAVDVPVGAVDVTVLLVADGWVVAVVPVVSPAPGVVPVVVVPVVVPEAPEPVEVEDEELVSPEVESLGCANAIPVLFAIATPTPNATANAPTRPT